MSTINAMQIAPRPAPIVAPGAGEETAPERASESRSTPFAHFLAEARTRPVNTGDRAEREAKAEHVARAAVDVEAEEAVEATEADMAVAVLAVVTLPVPNAPAPLATPCEVEGESPAMIATNSVQAIAAPKLVESATKALDTASFGVVAPVVAEEAMPAADSAVVSAMDTGEIPVPSASVKGTAIGSEDTLESSQREVKLDLRPEVRSEANPESVASTLKSAIQAAAARIGHGPEISTPGRRLGEVVVTAVRAGQSEEPVEGTAKGVALSDLVRQAIDGASEASDQQAASCEANGGTAGDGLKWATAHKPGGPAVTAFDLGSAGLGGATEGHGVARSRFEAPVDSALARVPESVSLRDAGDAVIRSVRYLSGNTDEVITVRLVPRSLGEMQVAVRTSAEGVDVVLTASTTAARDALEGHVAGLRQAMGREGIELNRVTIQVFGQFDAGHQTAPGQHGQQGQAGHSARYAPSAYRDSAGQEQGDRGQQQDRRQRHDGRLNMWA